VTLGQLRTFLAVVQAGSIRGAATALVVTEPSVSAAITALSRELGVPLTERVGRGIRLTEAGRAFAQYATTMLGLADRAGRAAREAAGRPGHVRVSAVTTAGEYILPPILAAFLRQQRDMQVTIEVGNRAGVLARLLNEQADLALGGRPPVGVAIEGEPFLDNPLVLVGRPDHPLRSRRSFDPRLLSGETWLLREPGSGTRMATEELIAANGIEPGAIMNVGSNGAIKRAAGLGLGVTMISQDAVGEELAAGELALLQARGTPLRRSWYVLYRKDAPLPASAQLFLAFLRSPATASVRAQGSGPRAPLAAPAADPRGQASRSRHAAESIETVFRVGDNRRGL
jgi:LysR family transcriptional regulator, low CO2-responsive transcriptional regulator